MFLNDITDAMSIAEAKRQQAKRKQEAKNSVKNQSHTLEENTIAEFAPGPRRDDNDEVPKQILILANRWWNAGDKQPQITNVLRSLGWSIAQVESEDDAVQMMHNDGTTYFISADDFDPDVFEAVCPDCGMCQTHGNLNEIKKGQKDSNGFTKCRQGYHAVGTKKGKNGGQVRNCKPNESQGVAEGWKDWAVGGAMALGALGAGHAQAADLSNYNTQYLQQVVSGEHPRPMVSIDDAKAELQARANGKQQSVPTPAKSEKPKGFSKEYLQSVIDGTHPRPLISKERAQELLQQQTTNEQGVAEAKFEPHTAKFGKQILGRGKEWDEEPLAPTYRVYVSDGKTWHREGGVYDHEMAAQRYIHQQVFTKNPQARVGIVGPGDAKPVVVPPIKGHTYKESQHDTVGFSVNSEKAYNAVMQKFSDSIEHQEDGVMYAPRKLWSAIERVAFDADGVGAEEDTGLDMAEDSWHGAGDAWHGTGDAWSGGGGDGTGGAAPLMEYPTAQSVPDDSESAIPGNSKREIMINKLRAHVESNYLDLCKDHELEMLCKFYHVQLDEYNAGEGAPQGAGVDDSHSTLGSGMSRREQRMANLHLAEMRRAGYFD